VNTSTAGWRLTEAGHAALSAAEQHGDGRHVYTGDSRSYGLTEAGAAALAAAEQLDLQPPRRAIDHELARLEKDFPQFTIWFAKISATTILWTAQLKTGGIGSVQENSATMLRDRLTRLVARLPKSA
jgi:hypothetical protein